jgi:ornithine cyclodeaminase
MAEDALWIGEADVVGLMDLPQAIDALEDGLRMRAAGTARLMGKTHVAWGGGDTLHAIGAVMEGAGLFGTKSWGHTAGGATPLLLLWRVEDGSLAAIIEAFALGQMRTGGIAGLATRLMAVPAARSMAVIGTGKQAMAQVAAVAAVRDLAELRVFSPTPEKRAAFAEKAAGHGFAVRIADSVAEAVEGAEIITAVTRARSPFLDAAMIAPGAHINAVGAITPERQEVAGDVFARVTAIAADDPDAAGRLSAELLALDPAPAVHPLEAFIAAPPARGAGRDLTLFKAMGTGLSDLSLGVRLFEAARAAGIGRSVPHPRRAAPRLFIDRKEYA